MANREPPLRVLQVASSLYDWGGIERYVLYLTEGLRARGHHVTVVCPAGSPLDLRIATGKIPLSLKGKTDVRAFLAYRKLFRTQNFDVVHAHFSPDFTLPGMAARGVPTVLTRHLAVPWSAPKVRRYLSWWRHIIPVSNAVQAELLACGVPAERMTVAKAGLPDPAPLPDRQAARAALRVEGFAVGSFSRLVKEKGVDRLVRAATQVEGVTAHIFGDGEEETALRALAGSSPRVRFHGRIADVTSAMVAMDAICIPSVWVEAFPYAALEALAMGVPILGANTGGIPEIVVPGVHGLLFSSDEELSGILRSPPAELSRMGAAGRARYEQEFTLEAMAERMETVYRRVISSGTSTLPF